MIKAQQASAIARMADTPTVLSRLEEGVSERARTIVERL
jgi:hypothetical protein